MVNYNPDFLDKVPSIRNQPKYLLAYNNHNFSLSDFLKSPRNVEELGIDFIHASSKIEGNTYDRFDTQTLLKEGITSGGKKYSDAKMILNLRDSYNKLMNNEYELSYKGICDIHFDVMDELLEDSKRGTVRTDSVYIGVSDYKPLYGKDKLIQEMKYMVDKSNTIKNPFEKAIYVHLNIAYLQFFSDGNKRTARMYQNAVLINRNIIPLLFDDTDINEYRRVLITYYETGNQELYIDWFLNNYIRMQNKLSYEDIIIPIRKSISENEDTED